MCEKNKGKQTSLTEIFSIILHQKEVVLIAKDVCNADQKRKEAERSYTVSVMDRQKKEFIISPLRYKAKIELKSAC